MSKSSLTGCIDRLRAVQLNGAALMLWVSLLLLYPVASLSAIQQQKEKKKPETQDPARRDDGKVPSGKDIERAKKQEEAKAAAAKMTPAEVIAELAIVAYGGRKQLETARAAIHEAGTIRLATDQGDLTGNYLLRSIRKEKSSQDLLRVDLELSQSENAQGQSSPPIKYVIGFNGASVWSAQNGQYVTPRAGADIAFRAQLTHEYMALLRYKEDGSKLDFVGPETVVGVDTNVVDMTTADGQKIRYWLSTKTYRVLHIEYELKLVEGQPPTKYRIDYYYTPLSNAVVQNTLLPVRREMKQDGKFVQEIKLTNVTYSAKLEPEIFQHLQEQ
ncbi:MAG TPA: hypothetical protein VLM38_13040 [Blastocatellia bacterium]|nr:hypothetical protein [Blastocatellia bacterium]